MKNLCRFNNQYCIACCGLKYESNASKIKEFMHKNTLLFYELVNSKEDLFDYVNERVKEIPDKKYICIYLGFIKPSNEPGCLIYPIDLKRDLRTDAPGAECEPDTICELMKEFQSFSDSERIKFKKISNKFDWLEFSLSVYQIFCQFRDPNSENLKKFKDYWDFK